MAEKPAYSPPPLKADPRVSLAPRSVRDPRLDHVDFADVGHAVGHAYAKHRARATSLVTKSANSVWVSLRISAPCFSQRDAGSVDRSASETGAGYGGLGSYNNILYLELEPVIDIEKYGSVQVSN